MAGSSGSLDVESVRSVDRALDLLISLAKSGGPTGLAEISRATSIPKTTAQRLLAALERRGFVLKEDGRYQIGSQVVFLARSFLVENSLTAAALPILEDLSAMSGETASLYVRQGFERVVVQRVESPHSLRYSIRIGQRFPLHLGAFGQILASALPDHELEELLERIGDTRLASGDIMTREAFRAKLARIKETGYAVSKEEREAGAASVAAPVLRPGRGTIAALGVTGPIQRMSDGKIASVAVEVRRAAQELAGIYQRTPVTADPKEE